MPKYAIDWLKANKDPKQLQTIAGTTYYRLADAADLDKDFKDEKSKLNKQAMVTHRDEKLQNAFHFVLQDKLVFTRKVNDLLLLKEDEEKYKAISTVNWAGEHKQSPQLQADLDKVKSLKTAAETTKTYAFTHNDQKGHKENWHPNITVFFPNSYKEPYDKCQCKSCLKSKQEEKAFDARIKAIEVEQKKTTDNIEKSRAEADSRADFEAKHKGTNPHDKQIPHFLNILLDPFQEKADDPKLVQALNSPDKDKNTSLHYAFGVMKKNDLLQPLLERIQRIEQVADKKALAIAVDENSRNIWHLQLANGAAKDVEKFTVVFSEEVAAVALQQQDKQLNTGLHEVLLGGVPDKRAKVEHLCTKVFDALSAPNSGEGAAVDRKATPLSPKFFAQNLRKENPFHLVVKRFPADEKQGLTQEDEIDMLQRLKAVCEKAKLYHAKLKEQDHLGNTPLHYAVQYGPIEKVTLLLKNLDQKQIQELITIKNTKGETPLHFAAAFAGKDILEELIKHIDPEKLFEMRREAKNFKDQLAKNNQIARDEFDDVIMKKDILLDTYYYFIHKQESLLVDEKLLAIKAKDFHNLLQGIANVQAEGGNTAATGEVEVDDAKFYGDTRHYAMRRELVRTTVTAEQAGDFLKRLERDAVAAKPIASARQILWGTTKAPAANTTHGELFRRPNVVVVTGGQNSYAAGAAASTPAPAS